MTPTIQEPVTGPELGAAGASERLEIVRQIGRWEVLTRPRRCYQSIPVVRALD